MKHTRKIFFLLLIIIFICGWGANGHKIINRRAPISLPSSMSFLQHWPDSLAAHASDADNRRGSDPNEAPRHFINIEDYPEFVATGRIPQNLDSLIALHGSTFVYNTGIVPFSVMATTDSVKKYFQLHNYQKAMLCAADLGHYVGDSHQPLHLTNNYDGQFTNQSGVHARYETSLIARDSANIIYSFENAVYISNVNQTVFNYIYSNHVYVDSVLKYDSIAHAIAGNTNSTTYYDLYWQLAGKFTIKLFNNASHFIASLIYTAWVNAGSPTSVTPGETSLPEKFYLEQNYPNPFNPSTNIRYSIPVGIGDVEVQLKVYDANGKEIETLVNEKQNAGNYSVSFNAVNYPSGVYFYKLKAGDFSETKRMMLVK